MLAVGGSAGKQAGLLVGILSLNIEVNKKNSVLMLHVEVTDVHLSLFKKLKLPFHDSKGMHLSFFSVGLSSC